MTLEGERLAEALDAEQQNERDQWLWMKEHAMPRSL
jgi:hypothetical protein